VTVREMVIVVKGDGGVMVMMTVIVETVVV
jgi:hypothetical protein